MQPQSHRKANSISKSIPARPPFHFHVLDLPQASALLPLGTGHLLLVVETNRKAACWQQNAELCVQSLKSWHLPSD
jgi:hypothetical protein